MKKVLLIAIICLSAIMLFACNNDQKVNDTPNITNNGSTSTNAQKGQEPLEKEYTPTEYNSANLNDRAGFEVVKTDKLSNISYDKVFLIEGENAQLDLKFDDGRIATLVVKKTQEYIDEEEVQNLSLGGYEVKYSKSLDGMNHYYWIKDNTAYSLIFSSSTIISNEEITSIIENFSIKPGDNY
jgi:hypothetical protein